jgi:hypothetical protein
VVLNSTICRPDWGILYNYPFNFSPNHISCTFAMWHWRQVSLSIHTRVIFKKPEVPVFVLWGSTMRKIITFSSPDRKLHHLLWNRFTAEESPEHCSYENVVLRLV